MINGKAARQQALRLAIDAGETKTQEQLAGELRRRGFDVTQATLSRDLREMGVGKTRTADGHLVYSTRPASRGGWTALSKMADSFVTDLRLSGNMVVVKTMPGYAQGVAAAVDALDDVSLLGTIAGDDTILVITADETAGEFLVKRLQREG